MSSTDPFPTFPDGFLWGSATASYQIEGAVAEDGRTPSIWDTFCATPGTIADGTSGERAADHYHRVGEDVDLMRSLGLQGYRFSVAWPRIQPEPGVVDKRGLDFYRNLTDRLVEAGIRPYLTLYHWDLPQYLQDRGGWATRDTAYRFAEFAEIVGRALGDRIETFTTLNEPWCSAYLGHATGIHAPGVADNATALTAVHHLLLGHGLGVQALRSVVTADVGTSLVLNLAQVVPESDSAEDLDAARQADGLSNRIFLDPIFHARYPDDVLADTAHITSWDHVRDGDLATIAQPIDLLGVNYYSPTRVGAATPERLAWSHAQTNTKDTHSADAPMPYPGTDTVLSMPQEGPYTAMGWRIDASQFTELLTRVARDYPGTPIVVTENGAAFDDELDADGHVHDADRIDYLDGHIRAVHAAITDGADIRGYFVWSLMDNFEWAQGLTKRFGVVRVDYDTLVRTPKDSALWYRDLIARHA